MRRPAPIVADLSGQTILITGSSSGIGQQAGCLLAAMGAEVVLVARDRGRGEAALDDVRRRSGSSKVSLLLCDFASQGSIRALAEQLRARHDRLDVLVNNAGLVSPRRQLTEDGIELTFAVNHLGYFLLTDLLLDLLRRPAAARIVNVSSISHRRGELDLDDPGYERGGYSILKAYGRSKLANVLFTRELARRLGGSGVTANSLHPGRVATNIWAKAPWFARPVLELMKKVMMISVEEGAETIVQLAAGPEVAGQSGGYYERQRLVRPAPAAEDPELAARLWALSEELVRPGRRG